MSVSIGMFRYVKVYLAAYIRVTWAAVVLAYLTQENGCNKEKVIHWKYCEYSETSSAEWKLDGWVDEEMGVYTGWIISWAHIS